MNVYLGVTEAHRKEVTSARSLVTESRLKTVDYVYETDDAGNESLVTVTESVKKNVVTTPNSYGW